MSLISSIYNLFNKKEKGTLALLLFLYIFSGFIEVAGVASVMPFVAAVSSPEFVAKNQQIILFKSLLGMHTNEAFLIALGVLVLLVISLSNFLALLSAWLTLRFTYLHGHELSFRLLARYLKQPYIFFLAANSADLARNVYDEVSRVVGGVILPLLHVLSRAVVAIFIFSLIVYVDPKLSMMVIGVLGGAYLTIYLFAKKKVVTASDVASLARQKTFRTITETLNAVKNIKLYGNESRYLQSFARPSIELAKANTFNHFLSMAPRYILELVAFGGIIVVILYRIAQHQDSSEIIPAMAFYAFAGYRIMPALQNIYANMNYIHYNAPALEILKRDLAETADQEALPDHGETQVDFMTDIVLDKVQYTYPESDQLIVDGVSLVIPANTSIAFVGATGSGKSTLVDLIMGLLTPQGGEIRIDGRRLDGASVRSWQKHIGYVPQDIFLSDDTIARNISMSSSSDDIDLDQVIVAAKAAQLHDFVEQLPKNYMAEVGDKGVRLSGGQKQRIGIARALYTNPQVLVLDEATSALDSLTEREVMSSVLSLAKDRTAIIIAHRLSTIQHCDQVIFIRDGKIDAQGTFAQLMEISPQFREMHKSSDTRGSDNGKNHLVDA